MKLNLWKLGFLCVWGLVFGDAMTAEARKRGGSYPSMPHNENFMSTCSESRSSVYNPDDHGSTEGGSRTRFGEKINSLEDAAKNGRPVSVSMDDEGAFGKKCNRSASRCLLLVRVPGIDRRFPAYARRFPNLPKDTILAVVEDRGDAFAGKGTGKIDIPIRSRKLALEGVGHTVIKNGRKVASNNVTFQVLDQINRDKRTKDYSHFKPFIMGRESKCSQDADRSSPRQAPSPLASARFPSAN